MKNLTKKLLQITEAADTVTKSGYNTHQKYSYSNEYDLHKTIKPLLKKYGVAVQWSVEEVSLHSNDTLALVKVKYTLTDVDSGETVESFSVGTGSDKQDKAVYKAMTGAHKYFIQKMFMISGDDDPENDDSKKASSNKPASASYGKKTTTKTKSDTGGFGEPAATAEPSHLPSDPVPTAASEGFGAPADTAVPSGFGGKTPDVAAITPAPDVEF